MHDKELLLSFLKNIRRIWRRVAVIGRYCYDVILILSSLLVLWQVIELSHKMSELLEAKHGEVVLFREPFGRLPEDLYAPRDRGSAALGFGWTPTSPQGEISVVEVEPGRNWAVRLARSKDCDPTTVTGLGIPIDGNQLRGKTIQLRAYAKWDSVQQGSHWYSMGQCDLYYSVPGGTSAPTKDVWEGVRNLSGSSLGWEQVAAVADSSFQRSQTPWTGWVAVPSDASPDMHLVIGLQECTGSIQFDWVEIVAMR